MMLMSLLRKRGALVFLAVIIALVLLPTGTPEDLVTTVPLFMLLAMQCGWGAAIAIYTAISAILIVALWRLRLLWN